MANARENRAEKTPDRSAQQPSEINISTVYGRADSELDSVLLVVGHKLR